MLFFFFNDTATTEIYTLSLHDALPIFESAAQGAAFLATTRAAWPHPLLDAIALRRRGVLDRKSTRLNSSHQIISYAVFCLKKKKPTIWSILILFISFIRVHRPNSACGF